MSIVRNVRRAPGRKREEEEEEDIVVFEEAPPPKQAVGEVEAEARPLEDVELRRYFIDTSWYEENQFSFNMVAQARMCPSCQAKSDTSVQERFTRVDPKTGRASFAMRTVPYGANPVRVIRECCSKRKDYVQPTTPTLEAVFRALLANGNQPMPLSHVRDWLSEWCPDGGCQWLRMPLEQLQRMVENDLYYGIRQHLLPVGV